MTKWAADVDVENPLPEYPRPQMVREQWMNLNGLWEFSPGNKNDEVPTGGDLDREILVPYPVESALSGVMEHHERLWYQRTFTVPEKWKKKRVLLHFGAIDWESEVFVNGNSLGVHQGGYTEISYDITDYITKKGEQELIVRVYDPTEKKGIPRGKQENPPHGNLIMYTPVTGIWQTVWMEPVEKTYIEDFKIVPDIDENQLKLKVFSAGKNSDVSVTATAYDGKKALGSVSGDAGTELFVPVPEPKLWSPDSPFLYDLKIELKKGNKVVDEVDSYFGMRKVEIVEEGEYKKIYLNNEFLYNFGFLDQGYWPDGLYTAPTDEALKFDVKIQKDFGYNMTRKHLKIEPKRWYYWADKLGLMVWQDMPSANSYRHNPPPVDTLQFRIEFERMIESLYNVPSITSWIIFNEMQGQRASDGTYLTQRMYDILKTKDTSRLINVASDNHSYEYIGDILDYHSYPPPRPVESTIMAGVCGEFGSVGYAVEGHEWKADEGVSFIITDTPQELEEIYKEYIHMLEMFKVRSQMSGAVFTQLTDVEQEINGFLTYDRVPKVDIDKIRKLNQRLIHETISLTDVLPNATSEAQSWKYTIRKPADSWMKKDFDDTQWKSGPGGFGNGVPPNTKINTTWDANDIWLRKKFEMGTLNEKDFENLAFNIYHDEDFEIYINGVLAASIKGYSTNYITVPVNEAGKKALNQNGINTIAVHCHQTMGDQYVDVGIFTYSYPEK